VVYGKLQLSR